ncbi:alpha-ribazole phosphatase [Paraburkholderia sacchari]|uniref:alpha-ribazole phosphatase n=1 Tax=Paraburkholderia sacchari TaxID=159450 RepID=UPI000543EFF4|nr:alpha-ribazole phosphatase [Paraburkholderia sacchari]NLP61762.1 alpha-ribazole phosphatase [Paraburkholderia sacchari]
MDLVLIRHPAVAVETGVCYGKSDVALAAAADAGAASIAARLAALDVRAPQRIETSPLARCASVARVLGQMHDGVAPHEDARLAEMDFGAWEMERWDAIERAQIDAWAADFEHARAHGGESVAQFYARVSAWFDGLDAGAHERVWAVAHAGVIRAVAARALDLPFARCARWPLGMAAIVTLRRESSGGEWLLARWNA